MSSNSTASEAPRTARTTRARRHRSQRRIRKESIEEEDAQEIDSRKKLRDVSTRMYYTKVITGLVTGILTGIIFVLVNGEYSGSGSIADLDPTGLHSIWILFPIVGLSIAMFVIRFVWKIPREEIDRKRLVLSGTFSLVAVSVFSTGLTWMALTELLTPGYIQAMVGL
ncbi:MAG: hypothetical protein ACFFD4_21390 [Candidatus Odinarchaeota archaeon]